MPTDPCDPEFAARVRASFARQNVMKTLGAELVDIAPGAVTIALPFREDLCQQHGYLHAGIITTVLDSACGYAALTLMAPEAAVLAVELKVNFIAPAVGARVLASGRVVRAGRTLSVCAGEAHAENGTDRVLVTVMQSTMMSVTGRGISG